ncbi:MAG: A/G-specific adenine glycosylase [Lachnospiraceae bacterium]|nr:A/G-specific adenine glycosylase [Lachnospiraceae bacterium]
MSLDNAAVESLLSWFGTNKRNMPWREDPSPYHVYVSEIMLQQTRVETATPYYLRFIQELPDLRALSTAPEERLLKLWEGLGYYSRVRNMKRAAEICVLEHGGEIPKDRELLLKLPGIGRYTAGAILSIAMHQPEPVADGNVLLVLSRLTGTRRDISDQKTRLWMEEELGCFLRTWAYSETQDPGMLNQALMELGALICLPNGAPKCAECPWKERCVAFRDDLTGELPVKSPKKARETVDKTVFVVRRGESLALLKNSRKGLLSGLYGLPEHEGHLNEADVRALFGDSDVVIRPLKDAKHIFTHLEWQMKAWLVILPREAGAPDFLEDAVFATEEETGSVYPVATAYKKWTFFQKTS